MKYVITKRDRAILIALFGLLVLGGVYYFVYLGYKDKTTQLKKTNQAIQNRVDVLQSIADQQADLVAKTNENNELAQKILTRFPSNVYEEDIILFAKSMQEFSPFESIPVVGIGAPEESFNYGDIAAQTSEEVTGYIPAEVDSKNPVATSESTEEAAAGGDAAAAQGDAATQDDAAMAAPDGVAPLPVMYERIATIKGQTDYDGFKNAIRFVVDNLDRSNLVVNASYDIETGMLETSMNIGRYYVTGTDRPYEEPEIRDVIQGTDNIFGTISLSELRPRNNSTHTEENNTGAENE